MSPHSRPRPRAAGRLGEGHIRYPEERARPGFGRVDCARQLTSAIWTGGPEVPRPPAQHCRLCNRADLAAGRFANLHAGCPETTARGRTLYGCCWDLAADRHATQAPVPAPRSAANSFRCAGCWSPSRKAPDPHAISGDTGFSGSLSSLSASASSRRPVTTIIAAQFVCALSVSGAIFLIWSWRSHSRD